MQMIYNKLLLRSGGFTHRLHLVSLCIVFVCVWVSSILP